MDTSPKSLHLITCKVMFGGKYNDNSLGFGLRVVKPWCKENGEIEKSSRFTCCWSMSYKFDSQLHTHNFVAFFWLFIQSFWSFVFCFCLVYPLRYECFKYALKTKTILSTSILCEGWRIWAMQVLLSNGSLVILAYLFGFYFLTIQRGLWS